MGNVYLEDGLRMARCRVNERKRKELEEKRRQDCTDAIVEFVSALFSQLKSTGCATRSSRLKNSSVVFGGLNVSPRDYGGAIAGKAFRTQFHRRENSNKV